MKIGIVGCGLIGRRRAKFLGEDELVIVADVNEFVGKKLAEEYNCEFTDDYHKVTQNQNVQELDTLGVTMPATQTQVTALEQASYNTMGKHLYQNRDLSHRY